MPLDLSNKIIFINDKPIEFSEKIDYHIHPFINNAEVVVPPQPLAIRQLEPESICFLEIL